MRRQGRAGGHYLHHGRFLFVHGGSWPLPPAAATRTPRPRRRHCRGSSCPRRPSSSSCCCSSWYVYISHTSIYLPLCCIIFFLCLCVYIYIYIYCMSICVLALLLAHRSEIRQNVAKFIIKRPLLAAGMYSSANFFFFFFFTNGDRSLLFLTCTEFQLISCFPCTTNLAS